MKTLVKLGFAAAAVLFASAAPASAATLTSYCEDAGSPLAGGGYPGRCSMGDVSTGTFDIGTYDAGMFGNNQGLIFKGFGDNGDADVWQFTATTAFRTYLDNFTATHFGVGGSFVHAFLTDPNGAVYDLLGATSNVFYGVFAAGTYSLQIVGAISPTALYQYDLRVQSVPVPAAAILFGSGLLGAAAAARRRRKTA